MGWRRLSYFLCVVIWGALPCEALISLDGSGTTNPSKFLWEVGSRLDAMAKPAVRTTYRGVGSSTGQFEFVGAENPEGNFTAYNDFGAGDIPLTGSYYEQLQDAGREVVHFPFLLGAMNFFHNVPGLTFPLNMSACVLAKVFDRQITTWDDSEILDLNPSLSVPSGQDIFVYHRVFGSSTTSGITSYLHAACPSIWGADKVGSTITWAAGTLEAQGSGNMAAALSSVEYAIGYIDSGHGFDDGLLEVDLQNADGHYQTSAQAFANGGVALAADEAVRLGIIPSSPTDTFENVSLINMPGNVTWPIVAVSYIYANVDQTSAQETGALLKAMMEYIISDEGQALMGDYNFVSLPHSGITVAQAAIDALVLSPNVSQWTYEPSSSTAPGTGQEDYVMSGKRTNWFAYAIENNADAVEELTTSVEEDYATDAALDSLETRVEDVEDYIDNEDDDDDHDKLRVAHNLAVGALILVILNIVFTIVVACWLKQKIGSLATSQPSSYAPKQVILGGPQQDFDAVSEASDHSDLQLVGNGKL